MHRFPPTFISYGGEEMFHDEIVEFIGELKKADVEVESFEAQYLFHVYEILMPWAAASKETIAAVAEFIQQRLDASPVPD